MHSKLYREGYKERDFVEERLLYVNTCPKKMTGCLKEECLGQVRKFKYVVRGSVKVTKKFKN